MKSYTKVRASREITEKKCTFSLCCNNSGLPLQGSNEIIGSGNNGNYLGILELISQFDPFVFQHISQFANRGHGHSSYFSKTICDKIVTIMGQKVLGVIRQEIVKSRYFFISVDSTSDITRTDQHTIIIRHVNTANYEPVERFSRSSTFPVTLATVLLILYFSTCQSRRLISIIAMGKHMSMSTICLANILACSKF